MGKKRFIKKGEKKKAAKHSKIARAKRQASEPSYVVGTIVKTKDGYTLQSANRKDRAKYLSSKSNEVGQYEGQLVKVRVKVNIDKRRQNFEIVKALGRADETRNLSLIAIEAHDIPSSFTPDALKEANAAKPVTLHNRTDLRDIPYVTIDGEDARDFDDAVYAEKSGKGWKLSVAIADVAHYVLPGSALDKDAYQRGNSTYFADRVVPMLPEKLSNDLCSLKPEVDRACMAVHMWINSKGELTSWRFERGIMRSRARLTYRQVQDAYEGSPDETTGPLMSHVITPLYGAYKTLALARKSRGTLDLNITERQVVLRKNGTIETIMPRERLTSHRLIEEFMITANVATALQLDAKAMRGLGQLCLYRVHEKPMEDKIFELRNYFSGLGITLPPDRELTTGHLTTLIEKFSGTPQEAMIGEVILRSQSQAEYSPDNVGHFGLALPKYAHFTSPIRRYADLMVHRALIRACNLGFGGLRDDDLGRLDSIGDHISKTERRSAAAERETLERYGTAFLKEHVGEEFKGTISGVTPAGLFVRLEDSGVDGFVLARSLPKDDYIFDKTNMRLIGHKSGRIYATTSPVSIRVLQAEPLSGSSLFELTKDEAPVMPNRADHLYRAPKGHKSLRGRSKQYGI